MFSISEICCMFCCPPCPGPIAAKLAFQPPEPTYKLTPADEANVKYNLHLFDRAEWQFSERDKSKVEAFFTRTSRGNLITCIYVRCCKNAKYTLLFSHGNAVDLGQMSSFYISLGSQLNCNIFGYDYSGYGMSGGKPSEKNLYADIEAAWQAMQTRFNISPETIILYGQSIGTVPTVDLATKHEVGAVILHSPLMSGLRVVFRNTKRTWFFDAFPSIDKVSKVKSPVLVIHGTDDEVIDFSHGIGIYERCPKAVEPLWVEPLRGSPPNVVMMSYVEDCTIESSGVNIDDLNAQVSNRTPQAPESTTAIDYQATSTSALPTLKESHGASTSLTTSQSPVTSLKSDKIEKD
ncbi:hypothetical protein DOY81_008644, partial [Sarcophaga bullata]